MVENLFRNTAWLFDVDNRDNMHADIPFYIDYAKKQNGEILELGCGTGRVSLALAREGFRVTGLDLSNEMLDVFRHKLTVEPDLKDKIAIVHGNMADFSLNKKFALVIAPFRAFQALTNDSDINSSLKCIKEHLTGNGIFIVNVFNPKPVMDQSWCYPETVQWERLDEATGNYVVRKHWGEKIDIKNQVIYPHNAYEVTDKNGSISRLTEDLKLKYYYKEQLQAVVENAGFKVKEKFGWYDKTTIEEKWREIIFVCGRQLSMIRQLKYSDLECCVKVIHKSFTTVAKDFALTEQNCPNHTSFIKLEKLQNQFDKGSLMFGCFYEDKIAGCVSLSKIDNHTYELSNLAVLPEYRHKGYGKELMDFCKTKVRELGGDKITIGIIEENAALKDWYAAYGFIHTGTQKFEHLPFTVGFMKLAV